MTANLFRAAVIRSRDDDRITPDEARTLLEGTDRRRAKLRAEHPEAAECFSPVSDELFRYVMERALLGELRRKPLLPPLDDSPRSPGDENAQSARPPPMIP